MTQNVAAMVTAAIQYLFPDMTAPFVTNDGKYTAGRNALSTAQSSRCVRFKITHQADGDVSNRKPFMLSGFPYLDVIGCHRPPVPSFSGVNSGSGTSRQEGARCLPGPSRRSLGRAISRRDVQSGRRVQPCRHVQPCRPCSHVARAPRRPFIPPAACTAPAACGCLHANALPVFRIATVQRAPPGASSRNHEGGVGSVLPRAHSHRGSDADDRRGTVRFEAACRRPSNRLRWQ